LIVPRLNTPFATYSSLFVLIGAHVAINYFGVQSLILRTMNHERLWTSWFLFNEAKAKPNFTPELVNALERIFPVSKTDLFRLPIQIPGLPRSLSLANPFKMETLTTFRNPLTQEVLGYVTLGSSFSEILKEPLHPEMIGELQHWSDFVLWFDKKCLVYPPSGKGEGSDEPASPTLSRNTPPHVHVCFRERSTPGTRVQAWLAAGLLCKSISKIYEDSPDITIDVYSIFLGTSPTSSYYDRNREWMVDDMVWKLAKPRKSAYSWDNEEGGGLWKKWRRHARKLGWDVESEEGNANGNDNERRRSSGGDEGEQEEREVDYGAELGVTVPEPQSVIVALGYSYEAKKDE
jgi:hypothetical protein